MAWFKAVDVGTLLDGAKAEADANMAEKRNAQNFILVYQSRCYVCTGTRDLCMLVSFVAENLVSCYGDEGVSDRKYITTSTTKQESTNANARLFQTRYFCACLQW